MEIIETTAFTRRISILLRDDEYAALQGLSTIQPDLGVLIPGGGGIRKLPWAAKRRGKSGGIRIIYYWVVSQDLIYMLTAYSKNEQVDLFPSQLQFLRRLVEEEFS
jgi:mRNA-degrading endonuclease RelE of RelBE toxin-antitoxin system